jgi:hypothetical protein
VDVTTTSTVTYGYVHGYDEDRELHPLGASPLCESSMLELILASQFLGQVRVVRIPVIVVAGFNVVELRALA